MFPFRKRTPPPPVTPQTVTQPAPNTTALLDSPPVDDTPGAFAVRVALHSDVGCVREINEDSVAVRRGEGGSNDVLIIVADGMGGHAAGEVASQMAVEVVAERYFASSAPPAEALRSAVEAANEAIFTSAKRDRNLHGMGTTCTVLLVRGEAAWCAHVGDSRLYLVRGGGIYQMSEDHSAVGEMVRRGLIAREDARHHPQSNVILRALGTQPQVEVALWDEPFPLRPGDLWLGCSDGLSDLVEDSELLEATTHGLENAGRSLIELARSRGGHDNISVVLAAIEGNGESASDEKIEEVVPVATREVNIP